MLSNGNVIKERSMYISIIRCSEYINNKMIDMYFRYMDEIENAK